MQIMFNDLYRPVKLAFESWPEKINLLVVPKFLLVFSLADQHWLAPVFAKGLEKIFRNSRENG